VLEEVGEAGAPGHLVLRPDAEPGVDDGLRQAVVGVQDDGEPVREGEGRDLEPRGRRGCARERRGGGLGERDGEYERGEHGTSGGGAAGGGPYREYGGRTT